MFPAWLRNDGLGAPREPNLSRAAQCYLDRLGLGVEDLFHHVLAVLHDPAYREANAGALRMGWPRIPLPGWPEGEAEGAAEALARSAARGPRTPPPCSIPIRPRGASPKAHCVRKSPLSPCPPSGKGAT